MGGGEATASPTFSNKNHKHKKSNEQPNFIDNYIWFIWCMVDLGGSHKRPHQKNKKETKLLSYEERAYKEKVLLFQWKEY